MTTTHNSHFRVATLQLCVFNPEQSSIQSIEEQDSDDHTNVFLFFFTVTDFNILQEMQILLNRKQCLVFG